MCQAVPFCNGDLNLWSTACGPFATTTPNINTIATR